MSESIFNQGYSLISLFLTLCIPIIGCSKETNSQNNSSSIIGTWQCPAPDKPLQNTEWGPMRSVYIIHDSGKIEFILTEKIGDIRNIPKEFMYRTIGTYKITDTTFETDIDGGVDVSQYSLNKDRLLLRNKAGKTFEYLRVK